MKNFSYFKNQLVDQGLLQISLSEANRAIPISNARVQILRRYDSAVVEELYTDSSGQTETISLGAPPLEYSLTPESGKPYSEYDISVSAEGFQTVNVDGVQILPDSRALQLINLREEDRIDEASRTIYIQEHTLWGNFPPKIPEPEVKPLPDAGGLIVLPEPVIPEFIVVHLGVPSDA